MRSPQFHIFIAVLLTAVACGQTAPLAVSQGRAAQRAGTKLVDVYYDVSGGVPPYTVSLQGSLDGGATWTLPVTSISGNVGSVSGAGTNRVITWNAAADWPVQFTQSARFRVIVNDSAVLDGFVLIPAGSFVMGQTSGDVIYEAPPRSVNLSAFYIGKYEVTKALWDDVRIWGKANGYSDLSAGGGKGSNHPVQAITWFDMVKWCNARSEKEGLTPVYGSGVSVVMKTGSGTPYARWNVNGFRLPTEAEWEKAARGGASGKRFPWGDTVSHSEANYKSSNIYSYDLSGLEGYHPTYLTDPYPYTSPAGSFAANGYGLYDMVGNVWEWCWDRESTSYYAASGTDPHGPESDLLYRVIRGGSWSNDASACRAAFSSSYHTGISNNSALGFRLVRSSIP